MQLKTIKRTVNKPIEVDELELFALTESLQIFDRDITLIESAEHYADKYGEDNPIIQDIFGNVLSSIGSEDSKPNIFIRMWDAFIKWIKGVWHAFMNLVKKIFGMDTEEDKTIKKLQQQMLSASNESASINVAEHFLKQTEEEITKEFLRIIATKKALNADKAKEAKSKAENEKTSINDVLGLEKYESASWLYEHGVKQDDFFNSIDDAIMRSFKKLKTVGGEIYKAIKNANKTKVDKLHEEIMHEAQFIKKVGSMLSGKNGGISPSKLNEYFKVYHNVYENEWDYIHKLAKYSKVALPEKGITLNSLKKCPNGYVVVTKYVSLHNESSTSESLSYGDYHNVVMNDVFLAKVAEEIKNSNEEIPKYIIQGVKLLGRFAAFSASCLSEIMSALNINSIKPHEPEYYPVRLKAADKKWNDLVNQTLALKQKK